MSGQNLKSGVGDALIPIEFQDAFAELIGFRQKLVKVQMSGSDYFLAIAVTARLDRVENLIPDDLPLTLRFSGGLVVDVDPAETRTYRAGRLKDRLCWLEFWVDAGRTILTLELADVEGGEAKSSML